MSKTTPKGVGTCPLCRRGLLESTPTQGRWECRECRATLLVGRAPAREWPETEEPPPAAYNPEVK